MANVLFELLDSNRGGAGLEKIDEIKFDELDIASRCGDTGAIFWRGSLNTTIIKVTRGGLRMAAA
eukprot:5474814-Pleurochrysis_carterae.AAC.1